MARGGTVVIAMASELAGSNETLDRIETRIGAVEEIVRVQLARAREVGSVREDVDLGLASSTICGGLVFAALRRMRERDEGFDALAFSTELADLVSHGIFQRGPAQQGR